jgi:hypothetical protein
MQVVLTAHHSAVATAKGDDFIDRRVALEMHFIFPELSLRPVGFDAKEPVI